MISEENKFEISSIEETVCEDEQGLMQLESLCMNCRENGLTKLMLTKIPYFREIILSSFECEHCGFSNNEAQFGGEIMEKGCRFTLEVSTQADLNRQLIKSDFASVHFPSLDFEIPAKTQQGEITTIEGIISTAARQLGYEQAFRMENCPDVGAAVAEIIVKLSLMASGEELPFTIVVDDPAGNSFLENPFVPHPDPKMTIEHYLRSPTQDMACGLQPTEAAKEDGYIDDSKTTHQAPNEQVEGAEGLMFDSSSDIGRKEVITLPSSCPNCMTAGESNMCITDIPHFKEIIIMAFNCQQCGFKSNEIKGGGAIPTNGTRMTLRVETHKDFSRDVLKSDSAGISIPEIELEIASGSLGGMYTTLEGVLTKMKTTLEEGNPFYRGDSATKQHDQTGSVSQSKIKFDEFMERFSNLVEGKQFPFTFVLTDPLGNSFIGGTFDNFLEDPQIQCEEYERSFDENEHLGLNDINVDNYSEEIPTQNEINQPSGVNVPILPDRLTCPHTKGPDHPFQFTRGCEDNETKNTQSS